MKILVCIKQVAEQEADLILDTNKTWARYDEKTSYWINRYDEYAVEAALLIKEQIPDTSIDIVSIGPRRVQKAVRRCMEMGADHGFHIYLDKTGYISPAIKSRLLAEFASKRNYDLIITGIMSEDMMSGQTGPMLAARLEIPSATAVIEIDIQPEEKTIGIQRELDSGHRSKMNLTLPALIAVQSGINRPRYPSFSNLMRAKKTKITEISDYNNIPAYNYEKVREIIAIKSDRAGIRLQGTSEEKAEELWLMLYEKSLI